jgi:aspartyl-tRNA synthetase
MNRTHTNGEFRLIHIGKTVTVVGWVAKRRNFGSIVFMDMRDRTGIVQCVFNEELTEKVKDVRSEYILEVTGTVVERKDKNPKLPTGDIEIIVSDVTIINTSAATPIIVADENGCPRRYTSALSLLGFASSIDAEEADAKTCDHQGHAQFLG